MPVIFNMEQHNMQVIYQRLYKTAENDPSWIKGYSLLVSFWYLGLFSIDINQGTPKNE